MNILLVDDDRDSRAYLGEFLRELGHLIVECANGEEALSTFVTGNFSLVLSDIRMPRMTGLELMEALQSLPAGREAVVVLFTGHGNTDTAIAALRAGAYDYLLKPINVEELAIITERVAIYHNLRREHRVLSSQWGGQLEESIKQQEQMALLKKNLAKAVGIDNIGFFSESMKRVASLAQQYHLDRSIPVLIQGETGTGKEIIAKLIHYGRAVNPGVLVDINCAAITPSLFESELFGYDGGSFTGGASAGKQGKLDLAEGGTIFFDEVGDVPLELQSKLLRVIQEKDFYRVGGLKKIKINTRFVFATNADLEEKLRAGTFRKDLYYRLKVGYIKIPPLRQRRDDILPLAHLFLKEFAKQRGKDFSRIGEPASQLLLDYPWPGNVRELRNVMEWVTFMHNDEEVKPVHLEILEGEENQRVITEIGNLLPPVLDPRKFQMPEEGLNLDDLVKEIVRKALENNRNNKAETARYLGISRSSLYSYLKKI